MVPSKRGFKMVKEKQKFWYPTPLREPKGWVGYTWSLVYVVYFVLINLQSWDPLHLPWSMDDYYTLEPHMPLGGFICTSIEGGYNIYGPLHLSAQLIEASITLFSMMIMSSSTCTYFHVICWGRPCIWRISTWFLPWDDSTCHMMFYFYISWGRPSPKVHMCDRVGDLTLILSSYIHIRMSSYTHSLLLYGGCPTLLITCGIDV